jgi:hypothetical protein
MERLWLGAIKDFLKRDLQYEAHDAAHHTKSQGREPHDYGGPCDALLSALHAQFALTRKRVRTLPIIPALTEKASCP